MNQSMNQSINQSQSINQPLQHERQNVLSISSCCLQILGAVDRTYTTHAVNNHHLKPHDELIKVECMVNRNNKYYFSPKQHWKQTDEQAANSSLIQKITLVSDS